jgi:hypothetical protein
MRKIRRMRKMGEDGKEGKERPSGGRHQDDRKCGEIPKLRYHGMSRQQVE